MKYEIIKNDKIEYDGHTLYRIKAPESIYTIKKGDLGGYIESPDNLSQEGCCWVADNAKVYGISRVIENSIIRGDAIIKNSLVKSSIIKGKVIIEDSRIIDSSINDNAIISHSSIIYNYIWNESRVDFSTLCYCQLHKHAMVSQSNLANCSLYQSVEISNVNNLFGARINGEAKINGDEDYILFKNHFSSHRYFIWTKSNDMWSVGCFCGTGQQLIHQAYKESEEKGKYYEAYVNFVEQLKQLKK